MGDLSTRVDTPPLTQHPQPAQLSPLSNGPKPPTESANHTAPLTVVHDWKQRPPTPPTQPGFCAQPHNHPRHQPTASDPSRVAQQRRTPTHHTKPQAAGLLRPRRQGATHHQHQPSPPQATFRRSRSQGATTPGEHPPSEPGNPNHTPNQGHPRRGLLRRVDVPDPRTTCWGRGSGPGAGG